MSQSAASSLGKNKIKRVDLTQKSPSCGRNRPFPAPFYFLHECACVHLIYIATGPHPSPGPTPRRREQEAAKSGGVIFIPLAQREEGWRGPMRSLRDALLFDPPLRLSASLFSPPVLPLRAASPVGDVKEKPTDLRKTNLAVNPTSKPLAVFEQSRWRAAGARSGGSGFQFLTDVPSCNPHLPPHTHHLPGGSLGRKVFLTGSVVGMGGGRSIHTVPLRVCLRSKSK